MKKSTDKPKKRITGKAALVILVILLVYIAAVTLAAMVIDGRHVRFYMTAPQEMELECFEAYQEPGVYAVTTGKLFGEGKKHLHVDVSSDLDNTRLGTYTVKYTVRYLFWDYSTERHVRVVDTTAPVLELAGYTNIRTKSLGSNNKQNVVQATIEGLKSMKTPEAVAKLRGKTVEEILG